MKPVNELSVGTFANFKGNVVYVIKNNFTDSYTLVPANWVGKIPQDQMWDAKVYVYKRIRKDWVERAKGWVEFYHQQGRLDNLSYIENLDILKKYEKPDIVKKVKSNLS